MHLFGIAQTVLESATIDTSEYRIAYAIDEVSHMLSPDRASQRDPDFDGAIRRIRAGLDPARSGWSTPQVLQRFDDSYNAQTLHPWLLPRLLVDPEGEWLASVSVRGPQLITGMRGCGKTMLLRAMDIHARIIQHEIDSKPSIADALQHDGYVGLYVSCTRLLDPLGQVGSAMHEPYARLLVAYAREACAGLQHIDDRQPGAIRDDAASEIGDVCASALNGADLLRGASSLTELEQRLQRVLSSLDRGELTFKMLKNPAIAFPQLGEAVIAAVPGLYGSQVLFLLDDVSTRHVSKEDVDELISALLFSHPGSAFKMTTEAQTFLRSPGQIEIARSGRDYQTFDLGAEVNAKLRDKNSSEGLAFVSQILENRAEHFGLHPTHKPMQLLGDATLESIAQNIVSTSKTSREKKSIYRGLSALRAVCVGDIGDVISIYDLMLSKARDRREMPIAAATQSEALQEFCARRLYQVNRRDGRLKDFALSFAGAAHELLVRSSANGGRLRQYNSIYVRLSPDATSTQYEQIRQLVDAGVFVLRGGTETPRTKSRDRDPMQQFALTFRKLFGLSSFIGLAERDRFELSGPELAEWLDSPSRGREILLRNLGGDVDSVANDEESGIEVTLNSSPLALTDRPSELSYPAESIPSPPQNPPADPFLDGHRPSGWTLSDAQLEEQPIEHVVLGLGFEERALDSAKELLERTRPSSATLVRYELQGLGAEIEKLVRSKVGHVEVIDYAAASGRTWTPRFDGLTLVDASGLAKGALFRAVLEALKTGSVVVSSTSAQHYYPADKEIEEVLSASNDDSFELVQRLNDLWSGEQGPYTSTELLGRLSDGSKPRVLVAASSAKPERLLSLLEARESDHVALSVTTANSSRGDLARLAAAVAVPDSQAETIDANDPLQELEFIARQFAIYSPKSGFELEVGLTGSKMQTVACAVAAACLPLTKAWYTSPAVFDPIRFSSGVGSRRTYLFRIG
ncbi:MAG: hypothetical protein JWR04_2597 [Rhodoglobus sp.]|nr:hypothetical protein [Rhodoglobus sp.]